MPSPCSLTSLDPRRCNLSERGHAALSIAAALATIAALTGVLTILTSAGVSLGAYNVLGTLGAGGGVLMTIGGTVACFGLATYLIPSKQARPTPTTTTGPVRLHLERRAPTAYAENPTVVVAEPTSARGRVAYYCEVLSRFSRVIISTSSAAQHLLKDGETLRVDGNTLQCELVEGGEVLVDSNDGGAGAGPGFHIFKLTFQAEGRSPIFQFVPTRSFQWDNFDHAVSSVATVIRLLETHEVGIDKWQSLTINRHRHETTTAGVTLLFHIFKKITDELVHARDKKSVRGYYCSQDYWLESVLLMAQRYDIQMGGEAAVTWWNQLPRFVQRSATFCLDPTRPGHLEGDAGDEASILEKIAATIEHTFPIAEG